MEYKYITDITHLFSDDPKSEMPYELLGFRDFLGHIIAAATVTGEAEFQSGIPCRKRVNRKACPGFVLVSNQSIPESFLYWHCSSCEDGGRIANWRKCIYDQSQFPEHPVDDDEPDPIVEVAITREEIKALLDGMIYDPDSERIIYRARPEKQRIVLRGRYGDMDNFVGFLAADANHEENKKRQKLVDSVYEKVEAATHAAYHEAGMGA
jgi:hypothetical protein